MPCERFDLGNGGFAIVCSRGQRKRSPCSACGSRPHERLCDFPLRSKKAGATCSKKLCAKCAVTVGELDLCPAHAKVPPSPPTRIFDHLEGTPEDRPLSRAAHAMRSSAWWSTVPDRDEPAPIAGEVGR